MTSGGGFDPKPIAIVTPTVAAPAALRPAAVGLGFGLVALRLPALAFAAALSLGFRAAPRAVFAAFRVVFGFFAMSPLLRR
jgi:hypothetical protein